MPQLFSTGDVSVSVPDGWRQIANPGGGLILQSPDHRQQVTVSISQMQSHPSLDEFKRICALRLQAEKQQLVDGAIEPNPVPFQQGNLLGLVYTGLDRKTRRIFSSYLLLEDRELVTLYLESFAIHPNQHTDMFKRLIANVKRTRPQSGK